MIHVFRSWLGRIAGVFRGLWVRFARSLRPGPRILDEPPVEPPIRVRPAAGPAPAPPHAGRAERWLDRTPRAASGRVDPVVRELRRRAVVDLFDWLGIGWVPGQVLRILDRTGDPGLAVKTFVEAVGLDQLKVRRREPEELARLERVVDLLIALDTLRAYLDRPVLERLEDSLFEGNYDEIERAIRVLEPLAAVAAGRERSRRLRPVRTIATFYEEVEACWRDPLTITAEEAEEARELSDAFLQLQERWTHLTERFEHVVRALEEIWPETLEGSDAALQFIAARESFCEIAVEIETTLELSPETLRSLIDEAEHQIAFLEDLLGRIAGAEFEEEAEAGSEEDELREAFRLYGIDPAAPPSSDELRRIRRRLYKEWHPDHGSDADRARREEMSKKVGAAYELLRRHFGYR